MTTDLLTDERVQIECSWCGKSNGVSRWLKGAYCSEFCRQEGEAMSNEQSACKVDAQGRKWSICGAPADQPCICDVYVAALPERIWLDLRDSPVSGKWRVYTAPNSFTSAEYVCATTVAAMQAELDAATAEVDRLKAELEQLKNENKLRIPFV